MDGGSADIAGRIFRPTAMDGGRVENVGTQSTTPSMVITACRVFLFALISLFVNRG